MRKNWGNLFKGDIMKDELDFVREGRKDMQSRASGIYKVLHIYKILHLLGKDTEQVQEWNGVLKFCL